MKKERLCILLIASLLSMPTSARSDETVAKITDQVEQHRTMVNRAVEFLKVRGQAEDGSFSAQAGVGPTGLAVTALVTSGVSPDDSSVVKGLSYLQKFVQPDGGIYALESKHRNYDTCLSVVAFSVANQNHKFDELIKKAEKFIKNIQWDEGEGKQPSDMFYGGAGYGSSERPDLSNTSYMIDALKSLGNGPEDEAIQKALQFVTRCQNLETSVNNSPFSTLVNDGGFFYTVAGGGESKAGNETNGGLRSYGSMTYAGLKSMIYAGVDKDDPRVKAATEFLRKNYDIESNPGMGQQGLFYYYHTMAKALDAVGGQEFADASGKQHDWKREIRAKLAEQQLADGSWINATTRWMEGDPNLVTSYALLALKYCKPK